MQCGISLSLVLSFKVSAPKQLWMKAYQGYIKLLWVDSVEIKVHIIIAIFHNRKLSFRQASQQRVRESAQETNLQTSKGKPPSTVSKVQ